MLSEAVLVIVLVIDAVFFDYEHEQEHEHDFPNHSSLRPWHLGEKPRPRNYVSRKGAKDAKVFWGGIKGELGCYR